MNTTVEPALIDTQQLDTFIDIGLVGYHDILGDLIREVPVCLDTIRTLIQDGDLPALARRVHSFRSASRAVMAVQPKHARVPLNE